MDSAAGSASDPLQDVVMVGALTEEIRRTSRRFMWNCIDIWYLPDAGKICSRRVRDIIIPFARALAAITP